MTSLGIIKFGDVSMDILSNSENMTVAEITFGPGVTAPIHSHFQEEANYILQGDFEMLSGENSSNYSVGDVLKAPSNVEHTIKNLSNETGKILTIWTPSRKDIIEKLSHQKNN